VIAHRRERFADELLVHVRAIGLRGLEERDATVNRRTDGRDALLPAGGGAIPKADAHAPETED
jgi:hypothetical protein